MKEADRLVATYPTNERHGYVQEKKRELLDCWAALEAKTKSRKHQLDESHEYQRYLNDHRSALAWITSMREKIEGEDIDAVTDVFVAKALCLRHQERKGEINARQDSFNKVHQFGEGLIAKSHFAASDLKERNAVLTSLRSGLGELWESRREVFEQCKDFHGFTRDADAIVAWYGIQMQPFHS